MLRRLDVHIEDLPGESIGVTGSDYIALSLSAGGYDWYIDATPDNDTEFSQIASATRTPLRTVRPPADWIC